MASLKEIAATMGGEVRGKYACFPTPGHSADDRGSTAELVPGAPDGVLIRSYNGGDPLEIKDKLRAEGVLPERAGWECTGEYLFRDETGQLLYRTKRFEHPDKPKRYEAELPNGFKKLGGVRRVLYRLPELLAADPSETVFLTEGERKADKLARWGLVATSFAFGAKSWRRDYAEHLANRKVVLLPDNDDEGRAMVRTAARDIRARGGEAIILELPGLGPKEDIIDWSGTCEALLALVDNPPAPEASGEDAKDSSETKPAYLRGISAAALMAKHFEPVNYVIPGLLAEGAFILAGPPKLGKSWLCYDFALAIASGRPVFGSIAITQGDVLYLALEDNERRLKSRLLKKGIREAPERLTLATEWPGLDGGCIAELETWADAVKRPILIIVDVLKMVRSAARSNESVYDADYRALTGLAQFARARGIAVLVVHHTRKMAADDPLESISGTNGLTGAADGVMVLKRDSGTGHCLLYVRGRDIEESEKAVRFEPDIGTWELLGEAAEIGRTNERQDILDVLRKHDKPMTVRDISDVLGRNYDATRKTLARMWDHGEIEKTGRGTYTCPMCPNVPNTHQPDNRTDRTGDEWGNSDPFDPREWEAEE